MTESELQKACRVGERTRIREILSQSPSLIDELDPNLGWPPLYRTITCGHYDASHELLLLGANPNKKNKLGDSPLHQAVESSQLLLVQLLLDYGADSSIQQNDGESPLHYACLKEFPQIVQVLLKYRANPNLQDRIFGKTPLHLAVESKNAAIIQLLLKYNARNDVEDHSGRTPSDLADDPKLVFGSVGEKDADALSKLTPSFDQSDFSVKADSLIEPEVEHANPAQRESYNTFSFGSDPHKNSLYKWLCSMKLEGLFQVLYSNGYDDLDFVLAQVRSSEPITPGILEEIGVKKPGERLKLLVLLEQEAFKEMRVSLPVGSGLICGGKDAPRVTLEGWLESIGLKKLYKNFAENGFEEIESLVMVMQSRHALTEESLKILLGIEKVGHRQRIMSKMKEELLASVKHRRVISRMSIEKDEPVTACEFCSVF